MYVSHNKKNVLRGIHVSPYGKLLTVLTGKIVDYVINIDDLTFAKYELNPSEQVYIPPKHGHLFVSLEENTTLLYQFEGVYDKDKETSINYQDPFINLELSSEEQYVMSEKDKLSEFLKPVDCVLFGSTGFLGSYTKNFLEENNKNVVLINNRLHETSIIKNKLSLYKPNFVICAAGISGKPTIEWCEENKYQTYKTNVVDILNLVEICKDLGIYIIIYGSGGIYKGDGLREYTETDKPNNCGQFYSRCRIMLEECLQHYDNVLYLRIQYPTTGDGHPKCFITKMLSRIKTIHNVPINVTHMPTMLPVLMSLIDEKCVGTFNFVNPEYVFLPELLKNYTNNLEIVETTDHSYYGLLDTTKLKTLI